MPKTHRQQLKEQRRARLVSFALGSAQDLPHHLTRRQHEVLQYLELYHGDIHQTARAMKLSSSRAVHHFHRALKALGLPPPILTDPDYLDQ